MGNIHLKFAARVSAPTDLPAFGGGLLAEWTSLLRHSGVRNAAACSANGNARRSRQTGNLSNDVTDSNDCRTLIGRLCTWRNMRPPAAAVSSASAKNGRQ